jgi:hypothetical protein
MTYRVYSFLSVLTLLARSHRLSWENLPAVVSRCLPPCTILFILIGLLEASSSRSGDLVEKWPLNLAYEHLYARKVLLHAVNLRRGTDGFTSPPKEVVLRMFITLKNSSISAGIEPATLGPVASTRTTSPPRQIVMTYA